MSELCKKSLRCDEINIFEIGDRFYDSGNLLTVILRTHGILDELPSWVLA